VFAHHGISSLGVRQHYIPMIRKLAVPLTELAHEFSVSPRTVKRWIDGVDRPSEKTQSLVAAWLKKRRRTPRTI